MKDNRRTPQAGRPEELLVSRCCTHAQAFYFYYISMQMDDGQGGRNG